MANEFVVDLGSRGTGWSVYTVIFGIGSDPEYDVLHGTVWNGSAFVTDSYANRNLGAIALGEELGNAGHFYGDKPAGITTAGTYPYLALRRMTGSVDSQNDSPLIDIGHSVVVADVVTGSIFVDLTYTPDAQATKAQKCWYYRGSGVVFQFAPDVAADIVAGDLECRISELGGTEDPQLFNDTNGKLSILDVEDGIVYVNPEVADTIDWNPTSRRLMELWRMDADNATVPVARVIIHVRDTVDQ